MRKGRRQPKSWQRLSMTRNSQLQRLKWCAREGHTWPPLTEARPGDDHWCDFCGARRLILESGKPVYEWPPLD